MVEQTRDALRHLEKDMADILEVMQDKITTEIILNPYRKKNGTYEGHILVDQHGKGLHNLVRETKINITTPQLQLGDWVIVKYTKNNPEQILYWLKSPILKIDLRRELATCIKNSFSITHDSIKQTSDLSLITYADNLEDGYISNDPIHWGQNQEIATIIEQVNLTLPISAAFNLCYFQINSLTKLKLLKNYPTTLFKIEIVKMSVSKAETIMSVLASMTGKFIHNKSPNLECRIPKFGHRFTGVIPPASNFPAFCIRKHTHRIYTLDDFVNQGILQKTSKDTIISWIKRKFNILIAGGTGAGKTTLANAILHEITSTFPDSRILIIEDVPELQFDTSRSISFSVCDTFTIQNALRTTLRFKPDRIVMGEIRGAEAYTLLKSWNTGHPGGIATIHANGVNEALYRFESCIRDNPDIQVNRHEIGFTINGIISIQNITRKEQVNGEYINIVKRKVTALRQIIQYDSDKDIYQDIVFDKLDDDFND